jgi:ABC-type amino acid transport system permease subunit
MGLGAIVSCIILIILLVKTWKLIRFLLDKGIKIPRKIPLWGYKIYLILLIPLMLRFATTSSYTNHDGSTYTHTFQYGGNMSSYTILYTAIAIMLYQLHANLKKIIKEQEALDADSVSFQSNPDLGETE